MSNYCKIAPGHEFHGPYHDTEYGFPSRDERVLHERLALEIFQAGLSWLIVLKKRAAMNAAFDGFDVDKVAAYGARDVRRLLADGGIIRNRLKQAGMRVLGDGEPKIGAHDKPVLFLHPKDLCGTLVEIEQA